MTPSLPTSTSSLDQRVDEVDGKSSSPRRPLLLDLFCGAGGCAVGYHRAGFDVVGVDIKPQPNYPFSFIRADALDFLQSGILYYDVIHASPPCQRFTQLQHLNKNAQAHPDLVAPVRSLLKESGKVWVIENVVGSPLRDPLMLCGSMFGLGVRRHRLFESSVVLLGQPCQHKESEAFPVWGDGRPTRQEARKKRRVAAVYGNRGGTSKRDGWKGETLESGSAAMGIDWMEWKELTQAIPPAYTEYIGRQLLAAIGGGK